MLAALFLEEAQVSGACSTPATRSDATLYGNFHSGTDFGIRVKFYFLLPRVTFLIHYYLIFNISNKH